MSAIPSKLAVEIVTWRPWPRNTLLGFATVRIPALCLTIDGLTVHESHGRRWVGLPAAPKLDRERNLVKQGDKVEYNTILRWDSKEVGAAFERAVLTALDRTAEVGS